MTSAEIVAAARGWIGTPFIPQGSYKGQGCDCAGLLIGLARELGVVAQDFSIGPYKQTPENGRLRRSLDAHLVPVPRHAIAPGHVAVMRWEAEEQHVAIVADYPRGGLSVVHALKRSGGVVEHRLDSRWLRAVVAVYALPGVV